MKSKVVSVLVVFAVLVVTLGFGCAPTEAPVTPTPEETMGPPIKVGVIGAMEGMTGQNMWMGAGMAVNEINEAGGVNVGGVQRPFELVKIDNNEMVSITDAVLAVERAIEVDKIDILIGGYRSESILAMGDVTAANKMIYIHGGASPQLTSRLADDWDTYKYNFRNHTNIMLAAVPVQAGLKQGIDALKEQLGIDEVKVAVLAEQALWNEPLIGLAPSWIEEAGGTYVDVWRPSGTATDLTPELGAIAAAGTHLVYIMVGGGACVPFQKLWHELQLPFAQIGLNNEAMSGGFREACGGTAADYAYTYAPMARVAITPISIPFWDGFTELYGNAPSEEAVENYGSMYALLDAIEIAGTVDDPEALRMALEEIETVTPQGIMKYYGKDMVAPEGSIGASLCGPHDKVFGPGYFTTVNIQWQNGKQETVWPDGWAGIEYEGTKGFQIPPWTIEYWKGK